MQRHAPAPLRWLLWLLGGLYLLYLIAGNVFLNTPASALAINRKPETFHAQWSWAWTLWPGQVHAYDLQLHGHARKLLWSARGDAAGGRLMLWPLLRREWRFGPISASAVAIDVQPTTRDHLPPPPSSDAWRLTFGQITSDTLRHVRYGALVADGEGVATVGFTHQLRGGETVIFPSHVTMTATRLRYAAQPLMHAARFDVSFAFDAFTHAQPQGWHKARRAEMHVLVDGATAPLALGAEPAAAQALKASALAGHLSADLSLDHGTLAPGGRLQWNAPVAITEADGSQQRRRGQFDLAVQPTRIVVHAHVPPPSGADRAGATHWLDAELQFASRNLLPLRPYADLVRLLSGTVKGRWHFASLRWLTPLAQGRPWLRLEGAGDVLGTLRIEAGRLAPGTDVAVPQVALRAGLLGNVFAGDAQAQVKVDAGAADARLAALLDVDHFTLAPANAAQQVYLRGRHLRVNLQSSNDLADLRETLAARLQFHDAAIPDLQAYNHYLPGKSLYFLGGSGQLSSEFSIDGHGDVSAGRLQLSSQAARLALGVSRLSGRIAMDTRIARATRRGDAYDLGDFTLRLDGLQVEGSRAPPWWTRISLQHGQLDWNRPMRLRGDATMAMKDVSLLLSLFADRSAFPAWITHVINDGRATARARIDVQRGDVILDHVVASNARVDLFAHLRVTDGQPDGDLYVRWGILGLGVALADGKRDFHLLHAQRWYQAQPDLLPAQPGPTR